MNISDAGLRFLMGWEGSIKVNGRHVMYDDGGRGRGNATIGIGHLIHYGPLDGRAEEVPFALGLTDDQALELLRSDVRRFEVVVDGETTRELNQNQYDAMVDFAFNTGGGYPRVWALVNAGQDPRPVLEVTAITAAGVTDPQRAAQITEVLKRRRTAEADLYNTPVEEDEMWRRFNGVAKWWSNRTLAAGPAGTLQLSRDFPLLPPCKAVDLDVYLSPASQGSLVLRDGSGDFAGKVTPRSPHEVIRCVPGWTRQLLFEVEGPSAIVETLGVVGYLA